MRRETHGYLPIRRALSSIQTIPVSTAREHGRHFEHPCSRPVNTGSVYRALPPFDRYQDMLLVGRTCLMLSPESGTAARSNPRPLCRDSNALTITLPRRASTLTSSVAVCGDGSAYLWVVCVSVYVWRWCVVATHVYGSCSFVARRLPQRSATL